MKNTIIALYINLLFVVFSNSAFAQYEVTTSVGDGPFGAFVLSPGETVDIDILLNEFDFGDPFFPRLGMGNSDGLNSFSIGVDLDGVGVSIESETDVAINSLFDDSSELSVDLLPTGVEFTGGTLNANGIEVPENDFGFFSLVLATVTVTGVVPDSEVSITASAHTNGEPIVFADGSEVAAENLGLGGIQILVSVPEPSSSLLLFGIGGFALTARKRRRAV